jgi:hypothetical protein
MLEIDLILCGGNGDIDPIWKSLPLYVPELGKKPNLSNL